MKASSFTFDSDNKNSTSVEDMTMIDYRLYSDIPKMVQEYIKTISGIQRISEASLKDINSFLKEQDIFHRNQNS